MLFALSTPTNSFSLIGVEINTFPAFLKPLGGHLGDGEGSGFEIFRGFLLFFLVGFLTDFCFFFVTSLFFFAFGVGLLDALDALVILVDAKVDDEKIRDSVSAIPTLR